LTKDELKMVKELLKKGNLTSEVKTKDSRSGYPELKNEGAKRFLGLF